jgi:hypothetical protein
LTVVRTPMEHVWCRSTLAYLLCLWGILRVFVRSPLTAIASWLLVSACGGNPDACSRFRVVVALSFMSLCMIPFMLMLDKDTLPPWPLGAMFRCSWCYTFNYFPFPFLTEWRLRELSGFIV